MEKLREIARPLVESDARELPPNPKPLQIRISAQMDIAAEHAGASEGDFDGAIYECAGSPEGNWSVMSERFKGKGGRLP